jgi:hypothetical protein
MFVIIIAGLIKIAAWPTWLEDRIFNLGIRSRWANVDVVKTGHCRFFP